MRNRWRRTVTVPTHWQTLVFFFLAISPLPGCLGQSVLFQWKFGPNVTSSLTECKSYPITLQSSSKNSSAIGSPPYFMLAFLPSGVPSRSNVGSDPSNLSWTVNQPSGSPLMLSVVDEQGDFGGQPSIFMTVVAGKSTSCARKAPPVKITIATNFTSPIKTCQPLGFNIKGGKKPYNFTLSALNSPVITSLTMGSEDDVFTYINRADPGTQLMSSVSDANGVWATSTQLFRTTGSTNLSCPGLESSSSIAPPAPKHHTSPAIPIAVSLVVAFLLLAAALGYFWRRRRRFRRFNKAGAAIMPDAWVGPSTNPCSDSEELALNAHDERTRSKRAAVAAAMSASRYRDASTSRSPASPVEHSADAMEDSPDIVIQHRDGGRVKEIPPPYFDHDSDDGHRAPSAASGEADHHSAEALTPSERTSRHPQ